MNIAIFIQNLIRRSHNEQVQEIVMPMHFTNKVTSEYMWQERMNVKNSGSANDMGLGVELPALSD